MLRFHPIRSSPGRRGRRIALSLLLLMVVSACDVFSPTVCTSEFVFGLIVEVSHSETGVDVDDESLVGTLVDGDYSETMERTGNMLRGAGERAGTYTMLVNAEGFEPWSRSGIEVEADACHVIPQSVDVRLTPNESM